MQIYCVSKERLRYIYNKISNCAHNETQHCLSSHIITFSATPRQIVVVGGGYEAGNRGTS